MGLATHEFTISFAHTMIETKQYILRHQEDTLMALLPLGSEIKTMAQFPIEGSSLALRYIMYIEHPAFLEGTKIELDRVSATWEDPNQEGKIIHTTVVTAVRYIKPDGTPLFS